MRHILLISASDTPSVKKWRKAALKALRHIGSHSQTHTYDTSHDETCDDLVADVDCKRISVQQYQYEDSEDEFNPKGVLLYGNILNDLMFDNLKLNSYPLTFLSH